MPVVCSHRIFCLKQADTMTETTDCQEQRLTVVLRQYSTPSNQWFIQLLPQALFLLVHLRYSLITSQRNHLMLMEHLLYQNCLHPHLLSLHRKQKEKVCHYYQMLHVELQCFKKSFRMLLCSFRSRVSNIQLFLLICKQQASELFFAFDIEVKCLIYNSNGLNNLSKSNDCPCIFVYNNILLL